MLEAPSSEEARQLREWVGFYTTQSLPGIVAVYRLVDDPEVKERAKRLAYRAIEALFKHFWREEVPTPEGAVRIGHFQVQGPGAWSDRTRTTSLVLWAILWSDYKPWSDREVQLMRNLIRLTERERAVYGVPVVRVGHQDRLRRADALRARARRERRRRGAAPRPRPQARELHRRRAEPIRCGLMTVACHFGELEEEPEKAFLAHKAARAYYGVLQADVPPGNRYVVEIVKFCLKAHRIDPNERDPVTGLQGVYKDDVPYWCWTDVAWRRDYRGLKCFCTGITPGFLAEWYALTAGREPACRLPAPREVKRRLPVAPAIPVVRRCPGPVGLPTSCSREIVMGIETIVDGRRVGIGIRPHPPPRLATTLLIHRSAGPAPP